jgi:hypothetical protein
MFPRGSGALDRDNRFGARSDPCQDPLKQPAWNEQNMAEADFVGDATLPTLNFNQTAAASGSIDTL